MYKVELRQRFFNELQYYRREVFVVVVMSIMGNALVHDTPKTLNGTEVGRVGRQEVQFHAPLRTFKPWLKYLGMMVTLAGEIWTRLCASPHWPVVIKSPHL